MSDAEHLTVTDPGVERVLVVGVGLIGVSVALALRAYGVQVWLDDSDHQAVELAVALGAGVALPPEGLSEEPELVVVAVPPTAIGPVIQALTRTYLSGDIYGCWLGCVSTSG